MTRYVTNQAELDKALKETNNGWDEDVVVKGSSSVVAWGSSRVEAWGSSRVVARGSSRVVARESSSVVARESSSVVARGSSSVVAWGSSRVVAWGSSRVEARGSSSVRATFRVDVYIFSLAANIIGGVHIDCTRSILEIADALIEWGVESKKGRIAVYKAVDSEYLSGHGMAYKPGTKVSAKDWKETVACGEGLHFGPTPLHAKKYFQEATRFMKCTVAVKDTQLCEHSPFPDKLKAKECRVLYEVDPWTLERISDV